MHLLKIISWNIYVTMVNIEGGNLYIYTFKKNPK